MTKFLFLPSALNAMLNLAIKVCVIAFITSRIAKGKCIPKKSGSILCEGSRLAKYQFIQKNQQEFGVRCLLRRLLTCTAVRWLLRLMARTSMPSWLWIHLPRRCSAVSLVKA